jgi:hypothetical protein
MGRFHKPEVVRLDLTQGDWILIHSRLNVGQQRKVQARTAKRVFAGQDIEVDLEKAGISNTAEYLLDWSFTDHAGQPVVIRDKPADVVMQILSNLDPDDYNEIADAIARHEKTLLEEKKRPVPASAS